MAQQSASMPSPNHFFDTVQGYQRTAAIKAAIELDIFSAIGAGKATAEAIAQSCGAAARGVRILCDYLTVIGFLTKADGRYGLTIDTATFLDRNSPVYLGKAVDFLCSPLFVGQFLEDPAAFVRKGGTVAGQGSVAPDHPVWVEFARAMAPLMAMPAERLASLLAGAAPRKVLDVAAGHGLYGIAVARQHPQAEITALDWSAVLAVAQENAAAAGVASRYRTLAGSAFEVEFGGPYDVVLLTNFLHHFDAPTCEALLRKTHAALVPGGRAVALEFIPNEDRISPPVAAKFALTMLGSTPAGDAFTFADYRQMFGNAGFSDIALHELPPTEQRVVIARR